MRCPYCNQEHSETDKLCLVTGRSLVWDASETGDTMLLHFLDQRGDLQRTYAISTDASLPPPGSLVAP